MKSIVIFYYFLLQHSIYQYIHVFVLIFEYYNIYKLIHSVYMYYYMGGVGYRIKAFL